MEKYDFETIKNVPYTAIVYVPPYKFHQSTFFKITYIESGSADIVFMSRTSDKTMIKKCSVGDAFIITPKDAHRYIVNKHDARYRHRDIYLSTELMKECCDFVSTKLYENIVSDEYPNFFKVSANEILALGEKLSPFINNKKQENLDNIHRSIAVSILGTYCICKTEKKLYPEWLQDLLRNLDKKDFVRQPIEDIVESTSYSHSYVSRVFKQYLKVPIKQYVNDQRFSISTVMLLNSGSAIENIANELGFETSSSFVKAFKKKYGTTPGKYRKTAMEKQTSIPFVDWGGSQEDGN